MRHTDYILATWTTTQVILPSQFIQPGSVGRIAEEAGICGNIARVDGGMNEQVSYNSRFDLGIVSKGMDLQMVWFGLGSNDPGK